MRWLLLPLEEVSGDVADTAEFHGALWVMLGDATGHGWLAHVAIEGLRLLWKALLDKSPAGLEPRDLLQKLDEYLRDCLPDGIYIEATLARFQADQSFTIAVAGDSRLILQRAHGSSVEIHRLGDWWLGSVGEMPQEQKNFHFTAGDEIALATDGLFDHPYQDSRLGRSRGACNGCRAGPGPTCPR